MQNFSALVLSTFSPPSGCFSTVTGGLLSMPI